MKLITIIVFDGETFCKKQSTNILLCYSLQCTILNHLLPISIRILGQNYSASICRCYRFEANCLRVCGCRMVCQTKIKHIFKTTQLYWSIKQKQH